MEDTSATPGPDWGIGNYERTAEALRPAAQLLLSLAEVGAGERVLDLGAGTGNAALLAAAAGARVTAVDPSPRLLSAAAAAATSQGLALECHVGDAASIPAPPKHFDCVLSSFGIVFAADPSAALAEVGRVLAQHGRALLTAWLPGGAFGALASACQQMVADALGAPVPGPGFPWHDEEVVGRLAAEHGLAASEVGRAELVFSSSSPEAFLDAELANHPLALTGMRVLDESGDVDAAREHLLRVTTEHNEDAAAFRTTSRYVVLRLRPTS